MKRLTMQESSVVSKAWNVFVRSARLQLMINQRVF